MEVSIQLLENTENKAKAILFIILRVFLWLLSFTINLTGAAMVCSIFMGLPKLITIWSVVFGVNVVAMLIVNAILSRPDNTPVASNEVIDIMSKTKSKNARDRELMDKFVNDILDYCRSIGLNPSLSTESGTCMIVNIRADDVIEDLIPLALPNQDKLTTKNYNMYLEYMKEQIDTEKLRLK